MSRTLALLLVLGAACLAASAAGKTLCALLVFLSPLTSTCLFSDSQPASHARSAVSLQSQLAFGPRYFAPYTGSRQHAGLCMNSYGYVCILAAVTVHATGAGEKVAPAATKAPAAAAKPPVVGTKQPEKKAAEANAKPVKKAKHAEGPLANANCTAHLCIGEGDCTDRTSINWFKPEDVVRLNHR
jgi:hypothetical protein